MLLFSHILMLDFKHVILNVKTFVKTVLRYINIEWLLGVGWGEGSVRGSEPYMPRALGAHGGRVGREKEF